MASQLISLPPLPCQPQDLLQTLRSASPSHQPRDLFKPFLDFEATLRSVYAQQPLHPALSDPLLNLVPVYQGHQDALTTCTRDPAGQSEQERDKYILPLDDADRRPNGSPALVPNIQDFKRNFGIFSESSLSELDWSNVVAAGSSVVTPLLPVPPEYDSKRGRRKYYHEKIAPASDVDLFLYGLTEEQAVDKIRHIESCIKDSVLKDTTTIRTKNAITIASGYPTRHVQIVLRIYKSISEILTGFDVDCSCAAFDGQQVYASPRALLSYMTQINTIDLARRSPSYENRLFKYAKRGFEVHWPQLDRSKLDPTIFERSFGRVQGLARLLVLERLPDQTDRESYAAERRQQKGRPEPSLGVSRAGQKNRPRRVRVSKGWKSDMKQNALGEAPDASEASALSAYHTFTVPYGPRYNAKNTEKLLYTHDLLLNATWNKPPDRDVELHRHPAFFGNFEDVMEDCCGCCPAPSTDEEKKVAEEESKMFISGRMTFIKDDPGRQAIGSFHPLTDSDWTDMAYSGNTARLCNAIVSDELDFVRQWCETEGNDVNRRDCAGRTPLHLAVMASSPRITQCLVDNGARLIARLADGKTALHLAALRGGAEGAAMIRTVLRKSEANSQEHDERLREQAKVNPSDAIVSPSSDAHESEDAMDVDDDGELVDSPSEGPDLQTASQTSLVEVGKADEDVPKPDDVLTDENSDDPDIYDVDVLSWDLHASALHMAVASGNTAAAEELVQNFGANVQLPVVIPDQYNPDASKVILPLVLAGTLPLKASIDTIMALLRLGASSSQGDKMHATALHRFAASKFGDGVRLILQHDQPAATQAMNHFAINTNNYRTKAASPMTTATLTGDTASVKALMNFGARIEVRFEDFIPFYLSSRKHSANNTSSANRLAMYEALEEPVVSAVIRERFEVAELLLEHGADVNALTSATQQSIIRHESNDRTSFGSQQFVGKSLLDVVRERIKAYQLWSVEDEEKTSFSQKPRPLELPADEPLLSGLAEGSWKLWKTRRDIDTSKKEYGMCLNEHKKQKQLDGPPLLAKKSDIEDALRKYQNLEMVLVARGAKEFHQLYPKYEHSVAADVPRMQNQFPVGKDCRSLSDYQIPDLNDTTRAGYDQLFEAAWTGDIEAVKALCLQNWGPSKEHDPLVASTEETSGLTPYVVALLRGHSDCAVAILQICQAQYEPPEEDEPAEVRYEMATASDDASEGGDSGGEIQAYSLLTDQTFTVDILQGLRHRVKCNKRAEILTNPYVKSLTLDFFPFAETSAGTELKQLKPRDNAHTSVRLSEYAVEQNKMALFDSLCSIGKRFTTGRDPIGMELLLNDALELSRAGLLKKIIADYGAGLPVDALAPNHKGEEAKAGTETSYPGLSVRGKKIKKWAERRSGYLSRWDLRDDFSYYPWYQTGPLLHAIGLGSALSVEWLLSEEPLQLYQRFVELHGRDDDLKALAETEGTGSEVINRWFMSKSNVVYARPGACADHLPGELAFHYAATTFPGEEQNRILQMLLKHIPEAVDTRSAPYQSTPLHVAFGLCRVDVAEFLTRAGADQTIRDNMGRNIIHVLLSDIHSTAYQHEKILTAGTVETLLSVVDNRVLPSLFRERASGLYEGTDQMALTPLAMWLYDRQSPVSEGPNDKTIVVEPDRDIPLFDVLLDSAPTEALDVFDGAGDTPLHYCVRKSLHWFAERILARRPDLLWRENANGRTPLDVAWDLWMKEQFAGPPLIDELEERPHGSFRPHYYAGARALTDMRPEVLAERRKTDTADTTSAVQKTFRICEQVARDSGNAHRKRRLVSESEANAVSERLAKRSLKRRKQREQMERQWRADQNDADADEQPIQQDLGIFATDYFQHAAQDLAGWDRGRGRYTVMRRKSTPSALLL